MSATKFLGKNGTEFTLVDHGAFLRFENKDTSRVTQNFKSIGVAIVALKEEELVWTTKQVKG